jgi:hypothetical protein
MGASSMTRRSLLRTGAGALAGIALKPALALASPQARPHVQTLDLGMLRGRRTVALPAGVAVVGLQWSGPRAAPVDLRVRLAGDVWGPWVSARGHGHGPDAPPKGRLSTGDPLWVGGATQLELRPGQALADARLTLVLAAPGADGSAAQAAALALAQPVLPAGAGQPPIIARSAWAKGIPAPRVAPIYGVARLAFVHHTENPNGYAPGQVAAMLRAIFLFHREVNGWNDIGYNFVVDRFGRIWEARAGGFDEPVVGAHAGGYNLVSTGVAVLGSFSGTQISPPARRSLQRLLAWKLSLHGTPPKGRVVVRVNPAGAAYSKYPARARVSLPRIAGHRDADSTACPGDALYRQLPGIRGRVRRLTGNAVRATLALVPAPAATQQEGAPSSAQPPQLALALARLDGGPVGGASVQLQARTVSRRGLEVVHTTVGEGVTDANGRCLLAAGFAVGARQPLWVRALYAGGPGVGAAVSTAVQVTPVAAPAPAPTPAPAPAPAPPPPTAAPAPAPTP